MALIGGGGGGFIGRVHLAAATLDGRAELAAGVFSSDPAKSRASAAEFGIPVGRAYATYQELIAAESLLPADSRADFVTIATPNHTHFAIAQAAVDAGFDVVCEKPMTIDGSDAQSLLELVERQGVVFMVSHCYTGYPLLRQARDMVQQNELGEILAARVSYIQGGLWSLQPGQTPTRAAWKADPAKAGPSGTMADIGTHAFNLLRFTTGLQPTEISSTLLRYHPARPLDDYGHALIRFANGAVAMISVSQVSHGRLNDFCLELDGTTGSLVWDQQSPDQLIVRRHGRPVHVYERNRRAEYLAESARSACRLPGGHPEGYLEAFANVYRDALDDMVKRAASGPFDARHSIYPNVRDGLEAVLFVQQCLASSEHNGAWQPLRG
jgi:predicted dehydrogenase